MYHEDQFLNIFSLSFQSRYFDCDDDESDTFSNLSALIDSDEFSAHVDNEFYCNGDDDCSYVVGECEGSYLNEADVVAKE